MVVVLPSLDPDAKFENVVRELVETGFSRVVIVDDGSSEDHQKWFTMAERYPACTVLHHGVNKGKGRALKTAFTYIEDHFPDAAGAVTIDGDGQHLTKDIIACSDALLREKDKVIMGCRDFDAPGVPPRSVAGNKTTSRMFRIFFGIRISDTQTGLRAIPKAVLPQFIEMEGERFEYETNMLLQMKRLGIGFVEQPIATVYDPEDYSSHYNAVKDSWRIFKVMARFVFTNSSALRYGISAVSSWVVDNLLYYLLFTGVGSMAAQIIARVLSSFYNFNMNRSFAFRSHGRFGRDLWQYYCVCIPQTLISVVLLKLVVDRLSISTPGLATAVKVLVDLVLFCVSYVIQKNWVFREKDIRETERK